MSKKVLIRKNAGAGVQGFYDISGQRPSFGQLANRTFRDPTASAWQKIGAGLGMLGKVGAAGVTGIQTAHGLQGGNMGAALQVPQAYMALDPTAGQANAVTPHEQQMEMQRKEAEEQRQKQLAAMNTLGISVADMYRRGARGQPAQAPQAQAPSVAVSQPVDMRSSRPASPHPAGNRPPGMPQAGVVNVGGGTLNPNMVAPTQSPAAPRGVPISAPVGSEVPQPAQPAAQPATAPQEMGGIVGQIGVPMEGQVVPVASTLTGAPSTLPFDPSQTNLNQYNTENPLQPVPATPLTSANVASLSGVPEMRVGQGQEEEEEQMDPYTNRPPILTPVTPHTNPYTKSSFTQMIFNEFGDMLHKADPHVAGLLAFRVYMDKIMR